MDHKKWILALAFAPLLLTLLLAALSFDKPVSSAVLSPPNGLPTESQIESNTRFEPKQATPNQAVPKQAALKQATSGLAANTLDSSKKPTPIVTLIYFSDLEQLTQLADLVDVWHVDHGEGYLVTQLFAEQMARLQALGFDVVLDEERTARLRELETIKSGVQSASQSKGIPGFPCYRTVEETYADMAALAADYPTLASWIDIGDSWDKVQYIAATDGGSISPPPDLPTGYDLQILVLTNSAFTPTVTTVVTDVLTNTITIPITQTGTPTSTGALTTTTVVTSYVPVTTTTVLSKPHFFLLAAIHARELTPAETAARFAERLVAGYGVDPDITWLLDYNQIHIVPIGNPDGRKFAEQLEWWRKNTNTTDSCLEIGSNEPLFPLYGVDLNRNSSFQWNMCEGNSCSSGDSCSIVFRGSAPASEPETEAIESYMRSIFADRRGPQIADAAPLDTSGLMISMHSFSELILYPWGFRAAVAPNRDQLRTLANKFGYFTGYRACQSGAFGCIYQTDGTTDDWSYGELGVSSFTFELGTEFFESCSDFEETVLDEVMPSLLYAAKSTRLPYQLPAGPEILNISLAARPTAPASFVLSAVADDTRFASHGFWNEPTQSIRSVRYSIDSPAWITGTVVYTMTALDASWDEPIENVVGIFETSGLSDGRHTLFVQGQDADGNWGVSSAAFFTLPITIGHQLFMPFVPQLDLE